MEVLLLLPNYTLMFMREGQSFVIHRFPPVLFRKLKIELLFNFNLKPLLSRTATSPYNKHLLLRHKYASQSLLLFSKPVANSPSIRLHM